MADMRNISRLPILRLGCFLAAIGCGTDTDLANHPVLNDEPDTDTGSMDHPALNDESDTDTDTDLADLPVLNREFGLTERPKLDDVRFWARSDQGVSFDEDNNVTAWASLDGTFGLATVSVPPPTLERARQLGDKPVIRFESDLEQWAGWAGLAIGTNGDFSLTYVARVRHDSTQVNNEWYIVGNNGTTNETRGAGAFYGNWEADQPDIAYDGFDLQPNGGTVDFSERVNDQWRVHTYTREAATSDVRYWVDGHEHTGDWASANWQNPLEGEAIVMVAAQIFSLEGNRVQQLGNVVIAELLITASNNVESVPALHAAMMEEYGIAGVAP